MRAAPAGPLHLAGPVDARDGGRPTTTHGAAVVPSSGEAEVPCADLRPSLLAVHEGARLPLGEALALADHLDACAECRRARDDRRFLLTCCAVQTTLRRRAAVPLPDAVAGDHVRQCAACRHLHAAADRPASAPAATVAASSVAARAPEPSAARPAPEPWRTPAAAAPAHGPWRRPDAAAPLRSLAAAEPPAPLARLVARLRRPGSGRRVAAAVVAALGASSMIVGIGALERGDPTPPAVVVRAQRPPATPLGVSTTGASTVGPTPVATSPRPAAAATSQHAAPPPAATPAHQSTPVPATAAPPTAASTPAPTPPPPTPTPSPTFGLPLPTPGPF